MVRGVGLVSGVKVPTNDSNDRMAVFRRDPCNEAPLKLSLKCHLKDKLPTSYVMLCYVMLCDVM